MTLNVTYCSKQKKEENGEIPAIDRYNSDRIKEIFKFSQRKGESFAILSGKYGLLKPEEEIPYYDKLLEEDDVEELVPGVREFLRDEKISEVVYHTREIRGQRKPYFRLIKKSCKKEGAGFSVNKLQ